MYYFVFIWYYNTYYMSMPITIHRQRHTQKLTAGRRYTTTYGIIYTIWTYNIL